MQETRRKIIEMLRLRGPQTVEDLVRAMTLTRTAVTTHLAHGPAATCPVRRRLGPPQAPHARQLASSQK